MGCYGRWTDFCCFSWVVGQLQGETRSVLVSSLTGLIQIAWQRCRVHFEYVRTSWAWMLIMNSMHSVKTLCWGAYGVFYISSSAKSVGIGGRMKAWKVENYLSPVKKTRQARRTSMSEIVRFHWESYMIHTESNPKFFSDWRKSIIFIRMVLDLCHVKCEPRSVMWKRDCAFC